MIVYGATIKKGHRVDSMTKGGGESAVPDLAREEKRRQLTIVALGIGLFVSTIPVNNQRALFSPLGDIPILGDLTPTAYAITFGGVPTGGVPTGGVPSVGRPGGGGPPVAYAARVPGLPSDGLPRGGQPFTGPPVGSSNSPPTSSVGNGSPGPISGFVPSAPTGGSGGSPGSGGNGGGLSPNGPGGSGGGGLAPPGAVGAVPEPATWLTMIIGFGVIGGVMRRARRRDLARGRRVTNKRSLLSEG